MRCVLPLLAACESLASFRGAETQDKDQLSTLAKSTIPTAIHAGMQKVLDIWAHSKDLLEDEGSATKAYFAGAVKSVTSAANGLEALEGNLQAAQKESHAQMDELREKAEEGGREGMHAVESALSLLETGARARFADPSSLLETGENTADAGSAQSLAAIGAKVDLGQLKNEVEAINKRAMDALAFTPPARASSLLETGENTADAGSAQSLAAIGAKVDLGQLKSEVEAINKRAEEALAFTPPARASSFVEEGVKFPDEAALDKYFKSEDKGVQADEKELDAEIAADEKNEPSSFLEEGHPISFARIKKGVRDPAEVEAKLQSKIKSDDKELDAEIAADLKDQPSSFLQEGAPDSFADIDAKLKAMEEKTKAELAKLQSDTAAPSSFLQRASREPAELDPAAVSKELQALEDKNEAGLRAEEAKDPAPPDLKDPSGEEEQRDLASFLPLPSSFLQAGAPDSFADIDAKLKAMEEKTKAELAKLQAEAPSSFLETEEDAQMQAWMGEFDRLKNEGLKNLDAIAAETPRKHLTFDDIEKKLHALEVLTGVPTKPASLLQADRQVTFDEVQKKIDALGAFVAPREDDAPPLSFVQLQAGAPDSFADIDAKLKALEEKTKAELAKLQSDTAAPSSFLQEEPSSFMEAGAASMAGMSQQAKAQSMAMASQLLSQAKQADSVEQFNRATDNQFAALRAKLRHFSEERSARSKSLATSFAQTSKLDHVPSWQENREMAETEIKRMRDFTARNEAEIDALRNHKSVSAAIQVGEEENAKVAMDVAAGIA
jgi:hypothetical protein